MVHVAHLLSVHSESIRPEAENMSTFSQGPDAWTYGFDNAPTSSRAKRLNCKIFPFLHFGLVIVLDQEHRFSGVDLILTDRVAAQIFNGFDCAHKLSLRVVGYTLKFLPGYTFPFTSTS